MSFQNSVLMIAAITLLILLGISAYTFSQVSSEATWPPIVANCPDYWVDLLGDGKACYNSKSLGSCNIPKTDDKNVMNFDISPFNGDDGACKKYDWANKCGVTWDGITYGVTNPCDTTTDTTE
jgi:hypothetical protein